MLNLENSLNAAKNNEVDASDFLPNVEEVNKVFLSFLEQIDEISLEKPN